MSKTAAKPIDLTDVRLRSMAREFSLDRAEANEKDRTCPLSFASEQPVERWFGQEILDCSEKACDLGRLRNKGSVLVNHDSDDQIGVVESAKMEGGKARAVVRFSKSQRGQEIFQDVLDGIRSLVSVGYRVKNMKLESSDEKAGDSYRVTEWEPYEISLVSIPADSSVGVGRSNEDASKLSKTTPKMAETATVETTAPATATVTREPAKLPDSQRMTEIMSIGANFKVPHERINKAIVENESLDSFRTFVMEDILKGVRVAPNVRPEIGMNRAEKRRYSIQRAISRISRFEALDGIEKEASDQCQKQYNREAPSSGFIIPHDVTTDGDPEMIRAMLRVSPSLQFTRYGQNLARAMQANNFTAAGALVATDYLGGSFIELLRNRMLLTQLGVGTMSGLVGNVVIPRQSGASTAYWLAEGAAVTASAQAFAQLAATPRRLAVQTSYSKQLLAQSSLDAEAIVRDDQTRVIAIARDLAGIQGTGGAQPLGILNGPTSAADGNKVNTVTFGTTATRANLLTFLSSIQTANADLGSMQWLTNPTVRAKWQSVVQVANYPVYLTNDAGETIGYPTPITNQIGTTGTYANRTIFGAWAQAMFFDWQGLDAVVDPFTRAANNEVVVTLNMFTDFGVRHWPSFCISTDSGAQ